MNESRPKNLNSGLAGSPLTIALLAAAITAASTMFTDAVGADTNWPLTDEAVQQRLLDDVKYLSSDELEGRGLTTKGLVLASEAIADAYAKAGLNTKAVDGSPFFTFNTRTWLSVAETTRMQAEKDSRTIEWRLDEQFRPMAIGRQGEAEALPLAFAGYSITDDESGYDDYASLDAKGKAVIVLRHEPQQDDPDSPFDGTKNSQHAYLVRKVQNAANHGAKLMILVNDAHMVEVDKKPDQLIPFQTKSRLATRPIPVIQVTREALAPLLGENTLSDWEAEIDKTLKPQSRSLDGWAVDGQIVFRRQGNQLRNVIGVLEPEGGAEETIIVGAHYDHLGRGGSGSLAPWTSAIHNGADDNGSGTAVLLEVARQVGLRRGELKRRVVFIAFSAEEAGLIGSARYVRAPLFPIDSTAAMVNLDMVGRLDKRLTVYGHSTGAGFEAMIDQQAARQEVELKKIASGNGPSDHASFNQVGVPVLHLFTGLHSDYHRPSDDYDKLNIEGMRKITTMTVEIVMQLASSTEPTRTKPRTLRDVLSGRPSPPTGATTLGVGVKDHDENGCLVTEVKAGGPAERAGVREGDVLIGLAGTDVEDVAALRKEVLKRDPGKQVQLKIRRGDLTLTVDVTLGKVD